jgi:hypothetical protein
VIKFECQLFGIKPYFDVFGRSPAGRAIRYIFFAISGQKRMPLLSLTHYQTSIYPLQKIIKKIQLVRMILRVEMTSVKIIHKS